MIGRLAWASVAIAAALAALGLAATAATLLLADAFGMLVAAAVMSGVLAVLAALGFWAALRHGRQGAHEPELLVVSIARDVIRRQPLSAVALFGALGFAIGKRPQVAAEIGRSLAKLMLSRTAP
jgi:hypothetical protein